MSTWAQDFYEIQEAVDNNEEVQGEIQRLLDSKAIHGKVVEGDGRTDSLRDILNRFFEGQIRLEEAITEVSSELPRHESPHSHDNRVFADGWDERLVRTQASRFYNQAVLKLLSERGDNSCFVPHSSQEDRDSPCTIQLAGNEADTDVLLNRLERTYGQADYHDEVKIPNHPHCTHTVVPTSQIDS